MERAGGQRVEEEHHFDNTITGGHHNAKTSRSTAVEKFSLRPVYVTFPNDNASYNYHMAATEEVSTAYTWYNLTSCPLLGCRNFLIYNVVPMNVFDVVELRLPNGWLFNFVENEKNSIAKSVFNFYKQFF